MTSIPIKTPEAIAELSSRQRKLSQRHRTALLLVDGTRTEIQIRQMALQAGCPDTCFDELVAQGMVAYADVQSLMAAPPPVAPTPVAAVTPPAPARPFEPDSILSILPASLTLQPSINDSILNEPPTTDMGALDTLPMPGHDEALEEARMILIRAVRAEAPMAGALTLLRLRRALTRSELEALLEDVELRITKPFKGLWATQTMARVRELLSTSPKTFL
jgi:hypothetical protein